MNSVYWTVKYQPVEDTCRAVDIISSQTAGEAGPVVGSVLLHPGEDGLVLLLAEVASCRCRLNINSRSRGLPGPCIQHNLHQWVKNCNCKCKFNTCEVKSSHSKWFFSTPEIATRDAKLVLRTLSACRLRLLQRSSPSRSARCSARAHPDPELSDWPSDSHCKDSS